MSQYYVYILTNRSGTLYVGVTSDLRRRLYEHRCKLIPGFTARYNIDRLVYYESTSDVWAAIEREKQIKRWRREKKVAVIESKNRDWKDLAAGWFMQLSDEHATIQAGQDMPRRDSSARPPDARRARSE